MSFEHLRHYSPAHRKCNRFLTCAIAAGLSACITTGFAAPSAAQPTEGAGKPEPTSVPVTVQHGESFTTVLVRDDETVSHILDRLHLSAGTNDFLTASRESPASTAEIRIIRDVVSYPQEAEPIPYETLRRENPVLYQGDEQVVQAGIDGERTRTYRTILLDGQSEQTLLHDEVTREPVPEIVEYGVKARPTKRSSLSVTRNTLTGVEQNSRGGGVLTTASGEALAYTKALTVTATAYTTERQSWKKTATGTIARVGAIAVDPTVIPYGTRMYIQTSDGSIVYGVATAEDCGSAIKGNKIDLFFDTYNECVQFGIRTCTVYVLA